MSRKVSVDARPVVTKELVERLPLMWCKDCHSWHHPLAYGYRLNEPSPE